MTLPAGPEEVREPDFEAALRWARCRLEFGSPSGAEETERDDNLARCYLAMSAQAPRMEAWVEAVVQFVYNYEYAAQRQATSAEIANALKAHLGALQAAERGKA